MSNLFHIIVLNDILSGILEAAKGAEPSVTLHLGDKVQHVLLK